MLPPYKLLRSEEDWSYLRDPARRTDLWDRIKYIPLGSREGSYLSMGGEMRPYYERFRNEDWGRAPQDGNGYLLQRTMLHFDLRAGKHIRAFLQFKSGIEAGRKGGPRLTDEDRLDLHQGFMDAVADLGVRRSMTLRVGRQEMDFGSSRLVSVREKPNVRQSFDGLRLILCAGGWRVDGFVTRPAETKPGVFDDGTDRARTFWGVYTVGPLGVLPGNNVDLYYLGLDRRQMHFDQGTAHERRHSVGTRLWNRGQDLDYNFEFVYQWGAFGQGKIRAWTMASDTGCLLRSVRWRPRIGLKADVTSGDRDPANPDLQTFSPLFPKGAYFGQIAATGPLNHRDVHPQVDLRLSKSVSLTVDWLFFWRQDIADGLYSTSSNLLRSGRLSHARYVGHQPGAEARWQIDRHTTLTANYAHFFAGPFLRESPPGRDIDYFAAWVTYKF